MATRDDGQTCRTGGVKWGKLRGRATLAFCASIREPGDIVDRG